MVSMQSIGTSDGNKRILFVIDHLGGGGAEQQFVNIVNNSRSEKAVYLTVDRGVRLGHIDSAVKVAGGYGSRTPMRTVLELRRIINSFRPDIVHACLMYSTFVTAMSLKLPGYRPVFVSHEFSSPEEILAEVRLPYIKKALLRVAYSEADHVLTIAEAVRKTFVTDGYVSDEAKTACIYDGLDLASLDHLETMDDLRSRLGLVEGVFYLCFAGSLVKRKGVRELINAFTAIDRKDMRLLVLGDGPEAETLKAMSRGDSRVEFLGFRSNASEYIKASDLFVLPSLYEGLPNVIIEAMAVGTPVLSTSVSGIPELIENEVSGRLVPPSDVHALRDAMVELAGDRETLKRYSAESLKRSGFFSLERMARDYEKFHEGLMDKSQGR